MKKILSADMTKISNAMIKKLVKEQTGTTISDTAAGAIAKLLEKKAKTMAKYAVARAKKKGRATVTEDDIYSYKMQFGE